MPPEIYKSDRTEDRKPPPNSVHVKTRCTKCQNPIDCYWPKEMSYAGLSVTPQEYMALALQSEGVGIYCDDCLEKMPDVKLEDLCYE